MVACSLLKQIQHSLWWATNASLWLIDFFLKTPQAYKGCTEWHNKQMNCLPQLIVSPCDLPVSRAFTAPLLIAREGLAYDTSLSAPYNQELMSLKHCLYYSLTSINSCSSFICSPKSVIGAQTTSRAS